MFWYVWREGRGSIRFYTWIFGCEGRKISEKGFLLFAAAGPHGLNHCRAELILHRICINGGNATCHCEMSGPLSHTAPDSIVYCLCPGVEPQTYKSKVWARSWGHLGRRAVQALHHHGRGTLCDSCSLTVNPPRQVGLLHRVIKATMPEPSLSLHPIQMTFRFVCSVAKRVHFSSWFPLLTHFFIAAIISCDVK